MSALIKRISTSSGDVEGGRQSLWAPAVLVLAAATLWGSTGTAQALGRVGDPVAVGAGRLVMGGAALVAIAVFRRGWTTLAACLRRPLLIWVVAGGLAAAVYQATFFSAVAATGVSTGTIVALGTAPIATAVFGAIVFGQRLTRWWAAATFLAVAGCVVLVSAGASGQGSVRPSGVVLAVLAGACYGVYTNAAKMLLARGVPALTTTAVTIGVGGMLLAPTLLQHSTALFTPRAIVMVLWLALATTAVAYVLFARGLERLPAATVGTLSLGEPLTAAALGVIVLGERPAPGAVVGGAILLAGLVLTVLHPLDAPAAPASPVATARYVPRRRPDTVEV